MNKTYWVLSRGEQPINIFFDESRAMEEGKVRDAYLDVFDDEGIRVQSLKLNNNDEWTEDF